MMGSIACLAISILIQDKGEGSDALRKSRLEFERARNAFVRSLVERGPSARADITILEKGPDPELRRLAAVARREIDRDEKSIRELAPKLGSRDDAERDQATLALRAYRRRAWWALETARRDRNPEIRDRATYLRYWLLAQEKGVGARYNPAAAGGELNRVGALFRSGRAPRAQWDEARLRWLGAQVRAGKIKRADYVKSKRAILAERAERLAGMNLNSVVAYHEVLQARLALAYLDHHLGRMSEREILRMQVEFMRELQARVRSGVMSPSEMDRDLEEGLRDWDGDLRS